MQKRALSLRLFWFFHNMSNFILKVFLCLFLLSTCYYMCQNWKDFPAPTTIFKIFEGLAWIFILKFKGI